jgi:hypothetical protein
MLRTLATKNMSKIIQWLPLIIAFVAGSFALYQIRSNNITDSRLKWLDNLKQVITDFISEITTVQLKNGILTDINERRGTSNATTSQNVTEYFNTLTESIIEHLKIVEAKYHLIIFAINPKEELHIKFQNLLDDYMKLFNQLPLKKNIEDYNALIRKMEAYSDTIVLLARLIMKIEWEKIKKSYLPRLYYMKIGNGKHLLKEALEIKLLPERQKQL